MQLPGRVGFYWPMKQEHRFTISEVSVHSCCTGGTVTWLTRHHTGHNANSWCTEARIRHHNEGNQKARNTGSPAVWQNKTHWTKVTGEAWGFSDHLIDRWSPDQNCNLNQQNVAYLRIGNLNHLTIIFFSSDRLYWNRLLFSINGLPHQISSSLSPVGADVMSLYWSNFMKHHAKTMKLSTTHLTDYLPMKDLQSWSITLCRLCHAVTKN